MELFYIENYHSETIEITSFKFNHLLSQKVVKIPAAELVYELDPQDMLEQLPQHEGDDLYM